MCLGQDLGAGTAAPLRGHLLPGGSIPSQGGRPRVCARCQEQPNTRLPVLPVQPESASDNEVSRRSLLLRRGKDDGGGQDPLGCRVYLEMGDDII